MRRSNAATVLAAAVVTGLGACTETPAPRHPAPAKIVLVTLDTFRADHLGAAGHPAVRTPFLDRLARGSTHWPLAVTAIPLTTPSHATILTGLTPRTHGVLRNRMVLPEARTTLAEQLRESGWSTGAVVSSETVLGPELDLDQGFDTYDVVIPESRPASGHGAETTAAALRWLEEHALDRAFLWVHYFDAHLPYLPPAPLDRLYDADYTGPFARPEQPIQDVFRDEAADPRDIRHVAALYAGEVTFLDRAAGRLLRVLPDDALIVVTADHGEGLREHERYFGHDILLYDTVARVPLLVRGAGPSPRLSMEPARTTDIAPTILAFCGVPPAAAEGRDLLGPPPEGDGLLFVLETHPSHEKAEPIFALRTDDEKVIWKQRERRFEYYDLVADPAERNDLGAGRDDYEVLAADLELDLRTRPPGKALTIDEQRGGLDATTREALRSLGYVD
ncbi:MAG: sulfatase [Candidatus Eiseniibacteriota bacterium]